MGSTSSGTSGTWRISGVMVAASSEVSISSRVVPSGSSSIFMPASAICSSTPSSASDRFASLSRTSSPPASRSSSSATRLAWTASDFCTRAVATTVISLPSSLETMKSCLVLPLIAAS